MSRLKLCTADDDVFRLRDPREVRRTDGLFFGAFPDAATAARVVRQGQALCEDHRLTGRLFAASRLHVTLVRLGEYEGLPPRLLAWAREAAATVAMAPFEVNLDQALSFHGRSGHRPFVLRGGEGGALADLRQALRTGMIQARLRSWASPHFTPHMTLLYDERLVPAETIAPIRWTVREFVLVHSMLGRTRHVPLGRWRLGD